MIPKFCPLWSCCDQGEPQQVLCVYASRQTKEVLFSHHVTCQSYFIIYVTASFLLGVAASKHYVSAKGNLPNLNAISSIVEQLLQPDIINYYVKPYIQSLRSAKTVPKRIYEPDYRATDNISVEKAIKAKIDELQPFLQDNDADKLDRDSHNESDTTIIEFIPKSKVNQKNTAALRLNTGKFKKLRDKVKTALEKEKITKKTKKLIMKTLDDMLANMVNNTCNFKALETDHISRNMVNSMPGNQSLPEWGNLRENFLNFTNNDDIKEALKMFKPFYNYYNKYIKQVGSDKYVVQCSLHSKDRSKKNFRKAKESTEEKSPCDGFKLCSEELKSFLVDFYNSLNDTVVSVFRNYAAMYERDVTISSGAEKDAALLEINKAGDRVEKKVAKMFKKELAQLNFDKNKNDEANVRILKEYIKKNMDRIKAYISSHLERDLKALKESLVSVIKQDIMVNLEVDLGNLKQEFLSKICRVFISCNGVYFARRANDNGGKSRFNDKNSVYVKLRLNLDKQLKDSVLRSNRQLLGLDKLTKLAYRRNGGVVTLDFKKYSALNITRTTLDNNLESTKEKSNSYSKTTIMENISNNSFTGHTRNLLKENDSSSSMQ